MRRRTLLALWTAAVVIPAAVLVPAVGVAAPGETSAGTPPVVAHQLSPSCGVPVAGQVACTAVLDTPVTATGQVVAPAVTAATPPRGYGPADLQSAYNLSSASGQGAGQTVAVVVAHDHPNAEADLAVYREQFGLPPCTSASGCFRKVGQFGSHVLPIVDTGWAQEISLDLDVVSAVCPNCKILLVEANDPGIVSIGIAEDVAVFLGATVISNSYISASASYDFVLDLLFYNHPGIPITASAGDNGYGVGYPAASPLVTAVGGTSLSRTTNARGWTETAWSHSGSGCAENNAKPPWQVDIGCGRRTVADVSAVADTRTGVAVYDSVAHNGTSGWLVFGGTSVSAPIIAGVYALAGNGRSRIGAAFAYAHPEALFDVVAGRNGSCSVSYLCTAGVGFDGPTGLGSPNGTGAF